MDGSLFNRLWVVLLCTFASAWLPRAGHAQQATHSPRPVTLRSGDVVDSSKRPRRIALLSVKQGIARTSDLFAPGRVSGQRVDMAAIEKALAKSLVQEPYVELLTPNAVRDILRADHSSTTAARQAHQWYRIGLEYYLSLTPRRAAETFAKSVSLYEEVFQDVVDAKAYADAQFMAGVALVDSGDAVRGHVALRRAFALQLDRRFRARFFAPKIERALSAALADLLTAGDLKHPYGDKQRLLRLARRLKVDALVTVGVTLGKDKKPWLTISVFRTSRRQIEDEISLPIDALPSKLDAFMSRWLACLPVLERSGSRSSGRRKKASVWLDTSASYAQYQRHTQIRRAFHSLGFAVGVAQRVGPGFEWYGRLNLYTSLSDSYRDLLHPFNSVRVLAGVGFATGKSPLRVFARTGLDFHILGNFLATRDPWCKAGGESHPLCSGSVTSLEQDILVGVNLAVGSQLHIGRRFFVVLQSSVSTYFLPFDGTNELNYPLSAELGMGYQF